MKALLLAALLLLSGCAATKALFTNPTGVITIPRQDFIGAYARVRELYLTIQTEVQAACRAGRIQEERCRRAAAVHEEAKAIDFEVRAKIAVPEIELDWAMIEKVIGFAVKLVL